MKISKQKENPKINKEKSMRIKNYIVIFLSSLIVFLLIMMSINHFQFSNYKSQTQTEIVKVSDISAEYGYFNGQMDALSNKMRIELSTNITSVTNIGWKWKTSPWDPETITKYPSLTNVNGFIPTSPNEIRNIITNN